MRNCFSIFKIVVVPIYIAYLLLASIATVSEYLIWFITDTGKVGVTIDNAVDISMEWMGFYKNEEG